ncbi:MAG: AmmeMemoRadiSam system protein B [Xanthomonadales bacterium]
MKRSRKPAVAGSFYPSDPGVLRTAVESLLAAASGWRGAAPRALVAPHAGYIYSGPVAASAYAALGPFRDRYRRVVLVGPAHRAPVRGIALPDAAVFETPLGPVPLDRAVMKSLDDAEVCHDDRAHRLEHSLEVQLPFLQVVLDGFSLVPLLVGAATPDAVARVIEPLWRPETLVVVSSDLSHYLPYAEARRHDDATCRAIETLAVDALRNRDACGAVPLKGLMLAAERRGLTVHTLDLRNSGDTAGDRAQVVGYGAWLFTENDPRAQAA